MNVTATHAALLILKYHGVTACIIGEMALNYYNVPRVCHDLEICVPSSQSILAASLLCHTRLFEPLPTDNEYNNYTEYKRGFPRVRTRSWTKPPQTVTIFPATIFNLDPLEDHIIRKCVNRTIHTSKEIAHLSPEEISTLPLPRLAPLLKGMTQKYLDTFDDMAMIAVEQLVDGMDLDRDWIERHFEQSDPTFGLIADQVRGKQSRIDYYSDNTITCYIRDEEEAKTVRLIA